MQYSKKLLDNFYGLKHAGILSGESVYFAELGSEQQGDQLILYLKIDDVIESARFQAYGSVALLASAEYVCSWLEGKSRQQALLLKPESILEALDLPLFKLHIANMICRTLQKVLT